MSKVIRTVKNVTKGYSSTQVKVRNATSNDPWGPTGTDMSEIARMTFETSHEFFEIMDMLDKRLNDKGKNWRHVLKALKVLDYCLHEGSEHVVVWAKDNIYIIKTLREFQYIDEEGRDQGLNVRISAKELTSLIMDEDRLRNERKDRKSWKSRVTGIEDYASSESQAYRPEPERRRPAKTPTAPRTSSRADEEDLEYRLAIEASKNQAEEDRKRSANKVVDVDDDLAKAIKLSKEEEELRQRELEQSNADSLFDDAAPTQQPQQVYQPTGYQQQHYQQLDQVDLFGDPLGQNPLQQQNTSYLSNIYSNPTGYQQQQFPPTGGYDQSSQMQYPVNNYPAFAPTLSPQQTNFLQPGDNNPYAGNQAAQPLQPLPTGSNNPFAPKMNNFSAQPSSSMPQLDSLRALQQQQQDQQRQKQLQQQFQFQQTQAYDQSSFSTPKPTAQSERPAHPQHAHLESLLAAGNDSGLDTYGNVGNLRIPAQHTAPGTFVNSAGTSRTGRPLGAQNTGTNPFLNQQFSGVPQSTGFGSSLSPQPSRLVPSHTGPAGMNGYGAGGFGQQQPGAYSGGFGQPQQQQQGGNLIDL